jgi:hypothetical protein
MKIPLKAANKESPILEEQYQERFWRRRLDGIRLDMVNKEFLAIEFKRTRDARSNYVERATAVAQEQYTSLLTGHQAVGQVKWRLKVQQIVFVGGTCGSVHVESFNKDMKALGVLKSQWDPIRNLSPAFTSAWWSDQSTQAYARHTSSYMSSTILLPPRAQLFTRSCSNKHHPVPGTL